MRHDPKLGECEEGDERHRLDADDHVMMWFVRLVNHDGGNVVANTRNIQHVSRHIQQYLQTKVFVDGTADDE